MTDIALGNSIVKKSNFRIKTGALIFLTAFFLYSAASPGNLPGDTEVRWSIARQIVRGKGVSLEDTFQTRNCAIGIDGKRYSLWNLGQSLCLVPFAMFGLVFEKVLSIDTALSDLAAQFLASAIFFPAVGAGLVWLFYQLVLLLNYSKRAAILSSMVLAFATMNLHYSVCTHEQSQVGFLLLLAIVVIVKNSSQPSFLYAWLLCAVFGLCLLVRLATLVMVLPMYVIAAGTELFSANSSAKVKILCKWLWAGFCGTAAFVAIICWYNYIRFGNIFESGHSLALATVWTVPNINMFGTRPIPTLAAMLFSPGKSIFLYNPVLLLLPACILAFYRKHKFVAWTITAAVISNFMFYSFFSTWAGDYAWGVRYQAAVLALLLLPLAELFDKPLRGLARVVVIPVIAASIAIQLASVIYNFNLEFVQNPNHCLIPDSYVWDCSQSHLVKRFDNIIRHIAGRRSFNSVEVINEEPALLKVNQSKESIRSAYCVNFFPFKSREMLPSQKLFYLLLSLWLLLLLGFCTSTVKLTQVYLQTKPNQKTSQNSPATGC